MGGRNRRLSLFPRRPRLLPRFPRLLPRVPNLFRRLERGPVAALAILAIVVTVGLGMISAVSSNRADNLDAPAVALPASVQQGTGEITVQFSMCGSRRYTCIVDGDTIWLEGQNLRLQSFDTPEPYNDICGGAREVALAKQASARLLDLLNHNPFTVETFGLDGTGKRTLATIEVGGRDVGDILIEERLARHWPDGDEWWCS